MAEKTKNQEAEQENQKKIELTEDEKSAMAGLDRIADDANNAEKESIKKSNEQEAQENAMAGLNRMAKQAERAETEAIKKSNEQEAQENAMAGLDRMANDANNAEKEAIKSSEREKLIEDIEGISTLQRRAAAMAEKTKNQEAEQENQEKINVESFEELKNNIEKLSDEEVGLALISIIDNFISKLENGEKIDDKDILEAIKNFQETKAVNEEQEKEPGEQKTEAQEWFNRLSSKEQKEIMNKAGIEGKTAGYTSEKGYTLEKSDDPEINEVNKAIEREWEKEKIEAELEKLREDLENNENEHKNILTKISDLKEKLKVLKEGVDPETQETINELTKTAEQLKNQDPAELGKTFKKLFRELGKDNLEEVVNMKESKKKAGGYSSLLFLLFAAIITNALKYLSEKEAAKSNKKT
jgi:hypothetical protein